MKVLVLGANGMLGQTVYKFLSEDKSLKVVGTSSSGTFELARFNALFDSVFDFIHLHNPDYVINCIGKIKPEIKEDDIGSVEAAIKINSLFPILLSQAAAGATVIQIATDCVFRGLEGSYTEMSPHDPIDVYGKTKSLGEVHFDNFLNLRCSIIGRELHTRKSLMEWVLNQPLNASISGFVDHDWNGITTYDFARLIHGIISRGLRNFDNHTQHIVPANSVNKFQLLSLIAKHYHRADIEIVKTNSKVFVNRTLETNYPHSNLSFWVNAGYDKIPSIEEMIRNYRDWQLK